MKKSCRFKFSEKNHLENIYGVSLFLKVRGIWLVNIEMVKMDKTLNR